MIVISFNVNGVRSIATKSKSGEKAAPSVLETLIDEEGPDVLVLQEIKTQSIADLDFLKPHYKHIFINTAVKKGYSGTAFLTNQDPEWVAYDFTDYTVKDKSWNCEGRIITVKFVSCIVITVYVPNSKPELARIAERLEWETYLRIYLQELEIHGVPIILCGDLNVAPQDIDIHTKQRPNVAGASKEEREAFRALSERFTDSYRYLYPDVQEFSWWSNFANSRERNKGWRIDLMLVSTPHRELIEDSVILTDYKGSDHCPVLLQIKC